MKYNGIELTKMLPENWDGKSREMIVWSDYDAKPTLALVCGFTLKGHPIADTGNYKKEIAHKNYVIFQYCAEIPKSEKEDVMKLLNDNEKEILELKEENDALKDKIKSLLVERGKMANAVSGAVWKELMNRAAKYESLIGVQMPTGFGFNDISDIVLNKIIDYKPENTSEKKTRRMTNRELAKWCAEGKGIFKNDDGNMTYTDFGFNINEMNEPVGGWIHIRGFDEKEWHEPLIEE